MKLYHNNNIPVDPCETSQPRLRPAGEEICLKSELGYFTSYLKKFKTLWRKIMLLVSKLNLFIKQ